jgi:hypothetical protein
LTELRFFLPVSQNRSSAISAIFFRSGRLSQDVPDRRDPHGGSDVGEFGPVD